MNINIAANKINISKSFGVSAFKQNEISEFESVLRAMEEYPEMKTYFINKLKNMSMEPKGENLAVDFLPHEDLLLVCRFFEDDSSFLRRLFIHNCQNKTPSSSRKKPNWTQDPEALAIVLNALCAARSYGDVDIVKDFCANLNTQNKELTQCLSVECKNMILSAIKRLKPEPLRDIYESRSF